MKRVATIQLHPLGESIRCHIGQSLRDVIQGKGVEFPCGGRGQCRGCRVRVVEGDLPPTEQEIELLSEREILDGWRLSCLSVVQGDVTLEVASWQKTILADETSFTFQPRDGYGIAIDLGTTTLAAQLLDLKTGEVMSVETALNPQAHHGADVMSRIEYAKEKHGAEQLQRLIRKETGRMAQTLVRLKGIAPDDVAEVAIVGNTAMHHLFCGIDITPLSASPFEPIELGPRNFAAQELGWKIDTSTPVRMLPCLGGFVGSDLLAGLLATELHKKNAICALVDLGTNGEIIVGHRERILCASTAAGPAFEGSCITQGMRAATGAIVSATANGKGMSYRVIGDGPARGICGSGLVDIVSGALDLQWIMPSGRFADGRSSIDLRDGVALTQGDVRQLQLAKGAIAAGMQILLEQLGKSVSDLEQVYLAGAFGNYISIPGAQRIGLLHVSPERVRPAGNTALLGAKMSLFPGVENEIEHILGLTEHVPLNADMNFQNVFVEEMGFPLP